MPEPDLIVTKQTIPISLYFSLLLILQVSVLGFGCAGLSGILNAPLSHEAGCDIIKEAYNRGITFFDTANIYGDKHDNEIMIGKVLYSFILQFSAWYFP